MADQDRSVLALNVGSSSLKAIVLRTAPVEQVDVRAVADRLGATGGVLRVTDRAGVDLHRSRTTDHAAALDALFSWLRATGREDHVAAVGHRVVHGGRRYVEPTLVTDAVLAELRGLVALDPDHLPAALDSIASARRVLPAVPHVACFDTAFHRTMLPVARAVPLPREVTGPDVVRFGFHGLSYEFVVGALRGLGGDAARGRLVIAHLGSGSSMAAVRDGVGIDTTMGFTPTGGLMMSTRSGDLDPGILLHLLEARGLDAAGLRRLVNEDAGLLGVSGTSGDMEALLAREADDPRAADAVALFCHLARKHLGALVAVLGGLDALVFTGGIGEHSAAVRARICEGVAHLGLALDAERNLDHAAIVSTATSRVVVRVIATDEQIMIARHARSMVVA